MLVFSTKEDIWLNFCTFLRLGVCFMWGVIFLFYFWFYLFWIVFWFRGCLWESLLVFIPFNFFWLGFLIDWFYFNGRLILRLVFFSILFLKSTPLIEIFIWDLSVFLSQNAKQILVLRIELLRSMSENLFNPIEDDNDCFWTRCLWGESGFFLMFNFLLWLKACLSLLESANTNFLWLTDDVSLRVLNRKAYRIN